MSFVEAFASAHREAQEAFNRGDFEVAFADLAPDVEWRLLPWLLETGVITGRDAVIRYFHGVRDGIDWEVHAQDFIDAGNGRVIIHQRGSARGRSTGISVPEGGALDFFQVWELGGEGRVIRITEFERREDALKAAGLSE